MPEVDVHDAKTYLSHLLERVAAGEEVVITRAGTPVAKLVPLSSRRVLGQDEGRFEVPDDFDAPLPPEVLDRMPDHVHLLLHLKPQTPITTALHQIKGSSSRWIHTSFGNGQRGAFWQNGYGAFSVSESQVFAVARYIEIRRSTIEGTLSTRS